MTGAGFDTSEATARALDEADPLARMRDRIPPPGGRRRVDRRVPRREFARAPATDGRGSGRGRARRLGRARRRGLVRRPPAMDGPRGRDRRTHGPHRGGAARRAHHGQQPDHRPAPPPGSGLSAGWRPDGDPRRCPDVPIGPVRRDVAPPGARARPGAGPHRGPTTHRGGDRPRGRPRGRDPRAPGSPRPGPAGRGQLRDRPGAGCRPTDRGGPRCRSGGRLGLRPRRRQRAVVAPRRRRRYRRMVHVQVPERRSRLDGPAVPARAPGRRSRDAAARRLVGQRPGHAVRDGRDLPARARRRRLPGIHAADARPGADRRLAVDLRGGSG